ncbi:MAG: hypothetical protein QXU18_00360 [Thermoplasmatales archaeon]
MDEILNTKSLWECNNPAAVSKYEEQNKYDVRFENLDFNDWNEGYTTELQDGEHLFCNCCGVESDETHDEDHIIDDVEVEMQFGCVPVSDFGIAIQESEYTDISNEQIESLLAPDY